MSAKELLKASSIILVGTVLKAEAVGDEISVSSGEMRARLNKVTIARELTIKGLLNQSEVVYFRYDCTSGCFTLDHLGWLRVGSRRVFFLTEENLQLRAVVDVRSSEISVLGEVKTSHLDQTNEAEAISRILLQASSHLTTNAFVRNLVVARAISRELVGRAMTIELMKPLLSHPSKPVRIQACLILAEALYDYDGCLQKFLRDPLLSVEERRSILQSLQGLNETQKQLRIAFSKDPMPWIKATSMSEAPEDIIDLIRLLTRNPDEMVSSRSCEILRTSFPAIPEPACHKN